MIYGWKNVQLEFRGIFLPIQKIYFYKYTIVLQTHNAIKMTPYITTEDKSNLV